MTALTLSVRPLRFQFRALDTIHFAEGQSANILRGAFGILLRQSACVPDCTGAKGCAIRTCCVYARLFEPAGDGGGPSGLADLPRPFVFRAAHLDGSTVLPGHQFHFDMHLFDLDGLAVVHLANTFTNLARAGLGPGRGRARLESVCQLSNSGLAATQVFEGPDLPEPFALTVSPGEEKADRLVVRFLTPTELKSEHGLVARPEFAVLFRRVRDRISTLRTLYGDGPLDIDFREAGERASRVNLVRCDLRQVKAERRSSRTGQSHSIGGFAGEVEYAGNLGEFLPLLRAARWTGVGRQTVWGKGCIELDDPVAILESPLR